MDEPNNDIDTETLQAQIDLSMAHAQNLVASWLPSSSLTHSSSSSRAAEAEAELQTLLRRPPRYVFLSPLFCSLVRHLFELISHFRFVFFSFFLEFRLGVGAPLPETSAPAQMRLIQKLQGGKKHVRNMENGVQDSTAASAMANDSNQREGEEEEEDTRAASAVRKRSRVVDPFESGGKNKKKMKKVVAEAAETAVEAAPTKDDVVEEAPPLGSVVATIDTTTSPSPKKRKRKRKNKQKTVPLPEDQGAQGHTEGPVVDVLPVEGGAQSLLEEWDGIGDFKEISRSGMPTRPSSLHSGMFCYWTPV